MEKAKPVPEAQRMDFIPCFLHFPDTFLFAIASRICPEYDGGYWEFMKTGDGTVAFSYPKMEDGANLHCVNPAAFYECDTDPVTFGMVVTAFCFNRAGWERYEAKSLGEAEYLFAMYQNLCDYAYETLPDDKAAQFAWLLD